MQAAVHTTTMGRKLDICSFLKIACILLLHVLGLVAQSNDGCKVEPSSKYGPDKFKLTCVTTPFAIATKRMIAEGEHLSELDVRDCLPESPVRINASLFASNPALREIVIQHCDIAEVAAATFRALWLLILDLSKNHLVTISKETFEGLHDLLSLYLEGNTILEITKGTFDDKKLLALINLGENQIDNIEAGSFLGLDKLDVLVLEGNAFYFEIEGDVFDGLSNLRKLYLGKNQDRLHLGNDTFRKLTGLKHLDLSGNNIFSDPYSPRFMKGLSNLTSLNLMGVDMSRALLYETDLSVYFEDQTNSLETLTLTDSNFNNDLMPMINRLRKLKMLKLDNNNIGYLLQSSLPNVINGTISLTDNVILYIEEGTFLGSEGLEIFMDTNTLYCSCGLVWFGEFLKGVGGKIFFNRDELLCSGPINWYRTKVKDYYQPWWQCSPYVPYVALAFVVGFCLLLLLIGTIIWCNRVNFRHWLLERRELAKINEEEERIAATPEERRPLVEGQVVVGGYNSLPKGKTGAYILYDMYDETVLRWVNQYIEGKLENHPLRIAVQWAAGPDYIPIWKQVKEHGFDVKSFLVVATEDFVEKYWAEISEKSGYENIAKFVIVLIGMKTKGLPKDLRRLGCPTFEWPESRTCCTTLGRRRTHFWKQVRLVLKGIPDTE